MIVVRLTNRKTKDHILKGMKKLKGIVDFVKKHLSQKMLTFPELREHCKVKIKYRILGQKIARYT